NPPPSNSPSQNPTSPNPSEPITCNNGTAKPFFILGGVCPPTISPIISKPPVVPSIIISNTPSTAISQTPRVSPPITKKPKSGNHNNNNLIQKLIKLLHQLQAELNKLLKKL